VRAPAGPARERGSRSHRSSRAAAGHFAAGEKTRRLHLASGVSFEEARELFEGAADYLELFEAEHSTQEDRFTSIGAIELGSFWCPGSSPEKELFGSSVLGWRLGARLSCSSGG
jgi:hypothetical protein